MSARRAMCVALQGEGLMLAARGYPAGGKGGVEGPVGKDRFKLVAKLLSVSDRYPKHCACQCSMTLTGGLGGEDSRDQNE